MHIEYATLETCANATGTVVVIDVLRAFTTAAYAFGAGATDILPVGSVEEAFALRDRLPGSLLMGEVGGQPVEGFDFGNSPYDLIGADLSGRRMIQRTSAGTQGVVRSSGADVLLAASFVCAGGTARFLRKHGADSVTFVITGSTPDGGAAEDLACADYIAELLRGKEPEAAPFLQRAGDLNPRLADWLDSASPIERWRISRDIECSLELDRFDFAMQVDTRSALLVMRKIAL